MKYTTIQQIEDRLLKDSELTVLGFCTPLFSKSGKKINRVICRCKCGNIKVYRVVNITKGSTFSCGCLHSKVIKLLRTKYPNANKHILTSYRCMIKRCYLPTDHAYSLYGGNGVTVCQEWKDDFYSFEKWSLNNGWAKGLVIDKDILGNGKLYSPNTCKWATQKENTQYRVNNKKYMYNGQLLTLSAICELKGVKRATIDTRIRLGMRFEEAIDMPIQDKNLNLRYNSKKK